MREPHRLRLPDRARRQSGLHAGKSTGQVAAYTDSTTLPPIPTSAPKSSTQVLPAPPPDGRDGHAPAPPVHARAVAAPAAVPRAHRGYGALKRAFDLAAALTALAAASPALALTAVMIRLDSPGPVIYRQRRVGRGGQPLWCYKFRTMVDGADALLRRDPRLQREFAAAWKLRDDPRVTRMGRWLRRTSMDELPQLLNVVRGEMSIVGPRPVQPAEMERQFGPWAPVVTSVKPGLTGLWQVSGRSSLSYEQRVALDVEYVRRRSIPYDLALVLRTVPAVLTGRGAV